MFPVIEVSGGPFERGRQHGVAARGRIERSIATYARLFAYCGFDWLQARALGARYRDPIGHLDADLLEEIEGIAAGSHRSVEEILTLNARTEILPPSYPGDPSGEWADAASRNRAMQVPDWGECTALAVAPERSASGGTLLAQNWDWLGAQRDAMILLRVRGPGRPDLLTLTEAGILSKIGLNETGFGVCLNLMRSRDDGVRTGMPVHVLLRRLLACEGVPDAESVAGRVMHGGSSNVLCADALGNALSLELSPGGMECVRPTRGVLCHTNHFLCPRGLQGEAPRAPTLSTEERFARIEALVRASPEKIGVEAIQTMLRDESDGARSICRHPDPALPREAAVETVAGVVMELAARVMHVAADIPSRTAFAPIILDAAVTA